MEIDEAPPVADKASRFRGSGTIGAPEGRGNRSAATVTVLRDELNSFAAGGRQSLRRFANARVAENYNQHYLPPIWRQNLRCYQGYAADGGVRAAMLDCILRRNMI